MLNNPPVEELNLPVDLFDRSPSTAYTELQSTVWNVNSTEDLQRIAELSKLVEDDATIKQLSFTTIRGMQYTMVPKRLVPEKVQNCFESMLSTNLIRGWEFILLRGDSPYISCVFESGDLIIADIQAPVFSAVRRLTELPKDYYKELPVSTALKEFPSMVPAGEYSGKIRYYPAEFDKPQYMKAGRYIKRARPDLSDEQVKQLAAVVASSVLTVELCFTEAGDSLGIAKVYQDGPGSCMSGSGRYYHDQLIKNGRMVHPTEVYGHPDNSLRLAYLKYNDNIVARAWTNCRTMTHGVLYGKCDQFRSVLETFRNLLNDAGYSDDPEYTVSNEKLLRIELDNGAIICPYIDPGNMGVCVEDDYLIVGGPYEANYETGCLQEWDNDNAGDREYCDHCDSYHPADEVHYSDNLSCSICEECAAEATEYAITGLSSRGRYVNSDYVWNYDAMQLARPYQGFDYVQRDARDFHEVTFGANRGLYLHIDEVHIDDNGDVWDMEYIESSNLFICEDCGSVCTHDEYNHEENSCLECSPLEGSDAEDCADDAQLEEPDDAQLEEVARCMIP